MKRDWELIRIILSELAEKPDYEGWLAPGHIKGYDVETVSYHYELLLDAGFIDADFKDDLYWARALTWQGHELYEQIKEKELWYKILSFLKEKGVGLSFEAIKMAVSIITKKFLGG